MSEKQKESTAFQNGQVTIRKIYDGYETEIVFKDAANPEAMDRVKNLIVRAYAERIETIKLDDKTTKKAKK